MTDNAFTSVTLPSHVPGVGYTLRHRKCVEELINFYCKRAIGKKDGNGVEFTPADYKIMKNRGTCHDMDKVFVSCCYPQLTSDYFHRLFNGHHMECVMQEKTKYDWIEMIFDWESARYTKPDKGLCAYEVATTFNQDIFNYVAPYLYLFGFTKPEKKVIQSIKDSVSKDFTEEEMIECMIKYLHTTRIHQLEYTSRLDDVGCMSVLRQIPPLRDMRALKQNNTFQRPTEYVQNHRSALSREFIRGGIQAQIFDMDEVCTLSVEELHSLENHSKTLYDKLVASNGQR